MPKNYPGAIDEAAMLANAKRNLAAFNFVGITEDFALSARLLCSELGWCCPDSAPHENRSGADRLLDRIDPETMDTLLECNHLDLELYDYAKALLKEHADRQTDSQRSRRQCLPPSFNSCRPRTSEANLFAVLAPPDVPRRCASIREANAVWTGQQLEVSIGFRVESKVETLVAGMQVADMNGNCIFGTNTKIEDLEVANASDCDCRASFTLEGDLGPGIYFVTVALHDERELGYHYHWIDNATRFEVPGNAVASSGGARIRLSSFESMVVPD